MRLVLAVCVVLVSGAAAHAAPGPVPTPSGPTTTTPLPGGAVICGPVTVAYGTALESGSLRAGETHCHRFSAAAGDRVRIRVVGTSGSVAPRAQACGLAAAAELTCVVGTGGVQTVYVSGAGAGAYTISVQRLGAPVGCTTSLYGPASRAGDIVAGETECRRFEGAAGDRVRVRLVTASATLDPHVEILRPNGTTRCVPSPAGDLNCTLDAGGTHTILVRGASAGAGGYFVSIQRLAAPAGCAAAAFGTSAASGQLITSGETDCWRVAGAAGDRVRVRLVPVGGTSDLRSELLRPDGFTECTPVGASDLTCELEATGTQTILVRDAAPGTRTGSYRLVLQRLNAPVGCEGKAFGTTAEFRTFDSVAETHCWRFAGALGDRVRIRTLSRNEWLNPTIEVIRPDGTTVCGAGTGGYLCLLDHYGTYTVLVRDWESTGVGTYGLAFQRLNDPVGCGSIEYEPGTVARSATEGGTDCVRFSGRTDDRVRVRLVETTAELDAAAEVVRPDGTTKCVASREDVRDCRLDADGTHTILVRHQDGTHAGDYRVGAQRLNDPVGCSDSRASWIAAGRIDCWRVHAEAGDRIRFRVIKADGAWEPWAEVVSPNGDTACARTTEDVFTCRFSYEGTFTLLVWDFFGYAYGGYGVDWQVLNRESLSCDVDYDKLDDTGRIGEAGEIDCFNLRQGSFGPQGTLAATRVRATSGNVDPFVELLGADGTTVCGPIPAGEWRGCYIGPNPARSTFLVYDRSGTGVGSYDVYASD